MIKGGKTTYMKRHPSPQKKGTSNRTYDEDVDVFGQEK